MSQYMLCRDCHNNNNNYFYFFYFSSDYLFYSLLFIPWSAAGRGSVRFSRFRLGVCGVAWAGVALPLSLLLWALLLRFSWRVFRFVDRVRTPLPVMPEYRRVLEVRVGDVFLKTLLDLHDGRFGRTRFFWLGGCAFSSFAVGTVFGRRGRGSGDFGQGPGGAASALSLLSFSFSGGTARSLVEISFSVSGHHSVSGRLFPNCAFSGAVEATSNLCITRSVRDLGRAPRVCPFGDPVKGVEMLKGSSHSLSMARVVPLPVRTSSGQDDVRIPILSLQKKLILRHLVRPLHTSTLLLLNQNSTLHDCVPLITDNAAIQQGRASDSIVLSSCHSRTRGTGARTRSNRSR